VQAEGCTLSCRQLTQGSFCLCNYRAKGGFVVYCQVSEDAAVQLDTGFVEAIDQTAVAQPFNARLGVDTGNPQATESALFNATVAVSVLTGFSDGLYRYSEDAAARSVVTFG
jgi:hypothetical protein